MKLQDARGFWNIWSHAYHACIVVPDFGITLDLSGKTEAWSVKSSATKGRTVVTFADNATITVDIGTRQVDSRTAIVSWDDTTRPSNLATLKFQLPNGMPLRKMSDGLYLKPGIVILFQ